MPVFVKEQVEVEKFIKVVTVWPQHVPAARGICQEGFTIPDVGRQDNMLTYESNIVFVMRYMVRATQFCIRGRSVCESEVEGFGGMCFSA